MSVRDNEVINLNTDKEVKKVLDLLGLTGDTGGSATAGTAMAKLNELQKQVAQTGHIITTKDKMNFKFACGQSSGKNLEPLSVQGRGKLFYGELAHINLKPNDDGLIVVKIDGKAIITLRTTVPSDRAMQARIAMHNISMAEAYSSSLGYAFIQDSGNIGYQTMIGIANYLLTETTYHNVHQGVGGVAYRENWGFHINGWVEFNESLEIQMTGNSNTSKDANQWKICYSLE